ncbi:hypothetical protein MBLNU13_g09857t2 [Cladosporium sp. NU13]
MPTLWLMFWLNYLDRNAIATTRLDGLVEDLNLSDSQYQTCVSILFVGYILGQIPSNLLITRLRPSIYMSVCMVVWATVSALTALSKDFKGLLLTRFFLGITEAPYYPGALYLLGIFYTRKEIATRISILYTGNILATAFAGLIAIGIFKMDGMANLTGWQWLFILQGVVTFAVAIGAAFVLPDDPLKTRWLTEDERALADARIRRDTVGGKPFMSPLAGLKEAACDHKLWLFAFMQHMHLAANGFKNFFPTAVETLGFNRTITLALTCPPYLIAGVVSIAWSWSSGRFNERTWHITIAKSIAVAGFVLGCATLNTGVRYFAMNVFTTGTYAVNSIVLGWVSSTCGQTKEKKASSLAIVNTIANISFIWTPLEAFVKCVSLTGQGYKVYVDEFGATTVRRADDQEFDLMGNDSKIRDCLEQYAPDVKMELEANAGDDGQDMRECKDVGAVTNWLAENGAKGMTFVEQPDNAGGNVTALKERASLIDYQPPMLYQLPYPSPLTPGVTAVGRVASIPIDTAVLKTGDLVVVNPQVHTRDDPIEPQFMFGWMQGFTAGTEKLAASVWRHSTYAEIVPVPLENVFKVKELALQRQGIETTDLAFFT